MTAAPLTVHNAEIRTATVEIKTLTVSGKQVTLAVFRQLIEEPLIDDDGQLRGTPWGCVNYCATRPCHNFPHLHVVWQKGSDLRRASVHRKASAIYGGRFYPKVSAQYMDACVLASLDGTLEHFNGVLPVLENIQPPRPGAVITSKYIAEGIDLESSQTAYNAWRVKNNAGGYFPYGERDLQTLREEVHACGLTLDELRRRVLDAARLEYERRCRIDEVVQHIAALPQLFIAV